MTRTIRTNPAYAYLAYRRAVLRHTINWLRSEYVGQDGVSPKDKILCEDVFREDSEIPPEEIYQFVEELQEQEAQVQLEINRFDFVKKDNDVISRKATKALPKNERKADAE